MPQQRKENNNDTQKVLEKLDEEILILNDIKQLIRETNIQNKTINNERAAQTEITERANDAQWVVSLILVIFSVAIPIGIQAITNKNQTLEIIYIILLAFMVTLFIVQIYYNCKLRKLRKQYKNSQSRSIV